MGTRGYIVYRYKKLYFYCYNHSDSYPDCLGLMLYGRIPRNNPEKLEKYLKRQRARLDNLIAEAKKRLKVSIFVLYIPQPCNSAYISLGCDTDAAFLFHVAY